MAEIIVKFDNKVIERIVTEKKRLSIGRTRDNDIVLENRGVSRKHAIIEQNENAAVVIDNESLNGTFVNNRKVQEEILRNQDVITIGKYNLVYHSQPSREVDGGASFDGTVVLNTKQHKKMLENDKAERAVVEKYGGSVLIGEENVEFSEVRLDRDVTTVGKAKFVHVRVKGMFLSGIQAKISRHSEGFSMVNIGKAGKIRVNGEPVEETVLKNGDLITVGKSTFKFVEGSR
jgi:pSer/pThr/pTyr-binding forkhead associated (FHA) protein